jgi:hypothetical protein
VRRRRAEDTNNNPTEETTHKRKAPRFDLQSKNTPLSPLPFLTPAVQPQPRTGSTGGRMAMADFYADVLRRERESAALPELKTLEELNELQAAAKQKKQVVLVLWCE